MLRESFDTLPQYLTPQQVAKVLGISTKTVIRKFENAPGVINIGTPRQPGARKKRENYAMLRIPREALGLFIAEHQVQISPKAALSEGSMMQRRVA